jgi:Icc-related predicted phosphoesterase
MNNDFLAGNINPCDKYSYAKSDEVLASEILTARLESLDTYSSETKRRNNDLITTDRLLDLKNMFIEESNIVKVNTNNYIPSMDVKENLENVIDNLNLRKFSSVSIQDESTQTNTYVEPKTKIYIISDIHSEFYSDFNILSEKLPRVTADICILAGDIGNVTKNPNILFDTLKFYSSRHKYVIMVPGNHEYYSCKFERNKVIESLQKICKEANVILLNRSSIVISGIKFIGATLWSLIDEKTASSMTDFQHVFETRIDYASEFIEDYRYIKTELIKSLDAYEKVVVITHHLPTKRLIHKRFIDLDCNSGFYTNILDTLILRDVKLWACGHIHEFATVKYGSSQVICNPMGYPMETRYTTTSMQVYEV